MSKLTGALGTLILLALAACGGSGGGGNTPPPDNNPPPTGGIGRTGIAVGPISTFGSIVVNGVRYDTSSASFSIDDSPGTEDDLKVGDIVLVSGTIDDNGTTGTAEEVFFDDVVEGPVQSIDPGTSSLVVLGQTVFVTPDTSFDDSFIPASLDGVSVGQIVEVSGQYDANGDIVATRIEPKPAGTEFEVHGTVSALDTTNLRFNLRNLVVDYSAATLDNFPGGQISEGDFVEAKGMNLGAADELLATSVEFENQIPDLVDGLHVEVEGFITDFNSAQDFVVAGFNVTTNGSTVFEGGTAADLGDNIKVEVEGDINASDILVATKVDIRRAKAVRAMAVIDSVDGANDSIVVLGITVNVDDLTRLEDKTDADVNPLSVSNLTAGEYVEVRGDEFPAGSGNILASILEREDLDTETILQGFVETTTNPSFTILGVTIETSGGTVFRDIDDTVMPAADFFNQLAAGDLVKASGTEAADTVISATEVEFELEL
jgi:hypothetical protein